MKQDSSYRQIAKSTGIFGSSQVINVFLGILRSKLMAILLGVTGVGAFGILQSIIDLVRSFTGLGLDSGAVKDLAVTDGEEAIGKTIYTINIWYLITALLGAIACLCFATPLSHWAFNSDNYAVHIMGLSIAVFFIAASAGLTAILQGLRKIKSMALASTVSSLVSLLIMIPVYYFRGIEGIVPMFILAGLITFSISFFFYRKLNIRIVYIPLRQVGQMGRGMLRLGLFIVIAGVISTGSILLVRAYISREDGLESVGIFHVAWMASTLFWGIVLRSANTDFYPKLCALIEDKTAAKRFINEQTYFTLLIISPIIIGLLVFSKYVIVLLFSSEFIGATNTLQWHFIGAFFKIASTPVATIILAKNRGGIHLICESVFWGCYLLAGYLLYPILNIEGLGLAYLFAYLVYMPVVLIAGSQLSEMKWSVQVWQSILINSCFYILIYLSANFCADYYYGVGLVVLLLSSLYSWYHLKNIFNIRELFNSIKRRRK